MLNQALPIVLLGVWLAIVTSVGASAATDAAEADRTLQVAINGGLLDLETREMPLKTVLREVAIEAGFALKIRGKLHDTVSHSFEGLTLAEAIRRLLDNTSFVFEVAQSDGKMEAPRLRRLIVYARRAHPVAGAARETSLTADGIGTMSDRARADLEAKLDEVRYLSRNRPEGATRKLSGLVLNDKNPFVREVAANVLQGFKGEYVTDALIAALEDKEASVRRRAIVSLGRVREKQVVKPLINILRWEPDEESRVLAAKALSGHRGRETLLALAEAVDDPSERVRNTAQSTLTRLKRTY